MNNLKLEGLDTLFPLNDNKGKISLIDYLGGDLSVVNDARVSYGKVSELLTEKDINLIKYLIKHEHHSPLRGTVFKFRVKAPLFLARQWWKHVIAASNIESQNAWNEKSFRYTEQLDKEDFYVPIVFRGQSKTNKQSSIVEKDLDQENIARIYRDSCSKSFNDYQVLINKGVCREQARALLNPAFYTEWVWTASLQAVLNFLDLRLGSGAQSEITKYAEAIQKLISPIIPITIQNWDENKNQR